MGRRSAAGAAAFLCALLIASVALVGFPTGARAASDVDPCGFDAPPTTTLVAETEDIGPGNPFGFYIGSGPVALQCSPKYRDFPPWTPMELPVSAVGKVDPKFESGFPYVIGPDGAEVTYKAMTSDQKIAHLIESIAGTVAIDAIASVLFPPLSFAVAITDVILSAIETAIVDVIRDFISEAEAMNASDWDWFVPSDTPSGNWYHWFTWPSSGEISPSSIAPALTNWYSYNPGDPYYQDQGSVYARIYVGITRVPLKQGRGITADIEYLAGLNNPGGAACTPVPKCFKVKRGASAKPGAATVSARRLAAVSRRRSARAGLAIKAGPKHKGAVRGSKRHDEIRVVRGDHHVRAGAGHDLVIGGLGDHRFAGGRGRDELTSRAGDDRMNGGGGHDLLQGGRGDDLSVGGPGSDSLFDNQGSDRMRGGAHDDRIVVVDETGDDVIDCGRGTDMVIADPDDRIALSGAGDRVFALAGEFTADHTPAGSTCERVYSSVHMPPREPPRIGPPAGRPPTTPELRWPVHDGRE